MNGQVHNEVDLILASSLKELALKRPIEKITIKEITDKAGVIRPTFYNHFQDKYELIEWIIKTEVLAPVLPLVENGMFEEGMVLLLTNIQKDKAFYIKAAKMEGPISFHEISQKCVREELLAIFDKQPHAIMAKYRWLTTQMVATYYAQTMCFAVEEWIRMGMEVPPREMAELYFYMLTHSVGDFMHQ